MPLVMAPRCFAGYPLSAFPEGVAIDSFLGTLEAEMDAIRRREQPALILERLSESVQALRDDLASVTRAQ